jgi:uncharacterized protein YbjT (DUF2867 family)
MRVTVFGASGGIGRLVVERPMIRTGTIRWMPPRC